MTARERQAVSTAGRSSARHQILDAAVVVFEREGYQAASIDAIAEAAGVSRRTIYHHFKTKNDILVGASLEQAQLFLEELKAAMSGQDDFPVFIVDCLCFVIQRSPTSRFFMLQMAKGVAMESATIYFNHPDLMRGWLDYFREPYILALRKGQINPAIELEALINWFGRVATSFLQYPLDNKSPDALRHTLDIFVGSTLRFQQH